MKKETRQIPDIIVASPTDVEAIALELLDKLALQSVVSCNRSSEELLALFKSIDCVFTDADGTVVEEGHTVFPPIYAAYIQQLAEQGVTITMITGKPLEEVSKVVASLPKGLPLKVIYEKGAYYLEPDKQGIMRKHYLLSTPELETQVRDLRSLFLEHKEAIEHKYRDASGAPLVTFGWSGSGTHKSILSIDIMSGIPPANYLEITGIAREKLKVKDPELLSKIEADLQDFVTTFRPGWRLVHIGNGNSDIAPGPIEKDAAILQTTEFQNAKGVLLWGDSGNDRKMFELRRLPHVFAGLVLHRKKSSDLAHDVDFISFGMANAQPFFELLSR